MASNPAVPAEQQAGEDVILGVDTHNDVHVAAVITVLGVLLGTQAFPTTAAGYVGLLGWARSHGTLRRAGVEGTSSHGTALTRHLRRERVYVIEINRPDRAARRRRGKTDALDAENAARAVLSGRATAEAKAGDGPAEAMRMFKIAKDFREQGAHPGDQPTAGRVSPRRARAARVADRTRTSHALSRVR
jgi:transposase